MLVLVTVRIIGIEDPASAAVSGVSGSAYGYQASISLFGGPANTAGPTPTVLLPPAGSASAITATAPSGSVAFGPATFFTSGQLDVSTQGTAGSGSVTSSTTIATVNTSRQEAFTASNLASTCTANAAGVAGSTTITGGTLQTDSGLDLNNNGTYTDPGEHAPVTVTLPTNPAPNTPYDGHIHVNGSQDNFRYVFNEQVVHPDGSITVYAAHEYLLGPTAVGDLFIGQAVCGVSVTAATADLSVASTDSPHVVAPTGTVTYTVTVTNAGPDAALSVTVSSVLTGARFVSATASSGACTALKGKVKGATCNLGSISSGTSDTITLVATAPHQTGSMSLTSTASSAATDPDTTNNTATTTTTIQKP